MNELRKAGRPKKHLEQEHHFHPASEVVQEDVVENVTEQSPELSDIFSDVPVESPEALVASSHVGIEIDTSKDDVHTEEVVASHHYLTPENLNGWHSMDTEIVLHQPPRNGMPVRLSDTTDGNGITAFWRRTRAFNGKRYEETGVWTDYTTSAPIPFTPKYWKERFN